MSITLPALAVISGAGLIHLLIQLIVLGLIAWLLFWLVNFISPPEPFRKVILCILAIAMVVLLVNALLSLTGGGFIAW